VWGHASVSWVELSFTDVAFSFSPVFLFFPFSCFPVRILFTSPHPPTHPPTPLAPNNLIHSARQLNVTDPSGNYSGWKATCIGQNNQVELAPPFSLFSDARHAPTFTHNQFHRFPFWAIFPSSSHLLFLLFLLFLFILNL
jgi:hypothetical protein